LTIDNFLSGFAPKRLKRRYRGDAVAPEIVGHGAALGARISTEGAVTVGDLLFEWIFVAHMSPIS
jgi:hypothetical protein